MPSQYSPAQERLRLLSSLLFVLAAGAAIAPDVRADIDLTGRWQVSSYGYVHGYAEIVQSGDGVTATWAEGMTVRNFAGTFDQTELEASQDGSYLYLTQYGDGATLDGVIWVPPDGGFNLHRRLTRCECVDGNELSGDGCDSTCRVEPCFNCTPEPSVCTPSSDTSACDDRNDCTNGETCSSGTCGGGALESPCVNLTGLWRVLTEDDQRGLSNESYTQRGGVLYNRYLIGLIDKTTGAIENLQGPGSYCGWRNYDAQATSDGREFTGSGHTWITLSHCWEISASIEARRCDPVSGCDLTDCTGKPNETPCDSNDVCSDNGICWSGVCQGEPRCPACTYCDEAGACHEGPRTDCRVTLDDNASKLHIVNREGWEKDRIRWSWDRGEATEVSAIDPTGSTDLTLCLFGEEGSEPHEVYHFWEVECADPPCWQGGDQSWKYRNEAEFSPLTSLSLKGDRDGKSRIRLRASGKWFYYDPLPQMPFTLPMRTQLQASSGPCFEATFGAAEMKHNDAEVFKGTGGTLP
jgi:cysteine-rich repeat protein